MGSVGRDGDETFDDASSGAHFAAPTVDLSRRSVERNVVSYFGIVRDMEGDAVQVDLVDLSANGARMIAPRGYHPPEKLNLRVPETGACFQAEIAWQRGQTFGLRFLSPPND
ncbi:MAG: PilZ domain-containing protein [Pseudomonadota bacterium]